MSELSTNPLVKGVFCTLKKKPYSKSKMTKSGKGTLRLRSGVSSSYAFSDRQPFLVCLFVFRTWLSARGVRCSRVEEHHQITRRLLYQNMTSSTTQRAGPIPKTTKNSSGTDAEQHCHDGTLESVRSQHLTGHQPALVPECRLKHPKQWPTLGTFLTRLCTFNWFVLCVQRTSIQQQRDYCIRRKNFHFTAHLLIYRGFPASPFECPMFS